MPVRISDPEHFRKQLEKDFKYLVEHTAPDALKEMILQVRDEAEANTPTEHGTARAGWSAGKIVREDAKGGRDEALAALADFKIGDNAVVYNPVYWAYYLEYGTTKMTPRAPLRGAIANVENARKVL